MGRGVDVAAGSAAPDGDQSMVKGVEIGTSDLVDGPLDRFESRADRQGCLVGIAAQDDPRGRVEGPKGADEDATVPFSLDVGELEGDHRDVRKQHAGLRQGDVRVVRVGDDAEVRPPVNARTEGFQLGAVRHTRHQNGHHCPILHKIRDFGRGSGAGRVAERSACRVDGLIAGGWATGARGGCA